MAKRNGMASVEPECLRIAERMGFELVDMALEKESTGMYLRFYIDRPKGISLDDCELYHKAVRPLVEDLDFDYMEVSSPGIDRPLKKDRDFERNLGSEIEIRLYQPLGGKKTLSGILAGLEKGEILLDTPEGTLRVERKKAALVRPVVDMTGIEEVDLSGPEEEKV